MSPQQRTGFTESVAENGVVPEIPVSAAVFDVHLRPVLAGLK